ncbi:NBS-LRR resistance-like protein [Gossypium australe]|uniref:NBS-LRR resistance-like protein n=1 Tax=Gossypium australe TaxID=47621 RepID=A0A5B6V1G1_9ROSI|nr:NBS-LRR resistance-like protein [Gossypium australe]
MLAQLSIENDELVQQGIIENFSINENDCLRFRNRICVPNVVDLKDLILCKAHDSLFAMHPGGAKVYRDLRESYWWPKMKREIVKYVAKYLTFLARKGRASSSYWFITTNFYSRMKMGAYHDGFHSWHVDFTQQKKCHMGNS